MYRDKTLIPTEAIRLLALGMLAERPRAYGDLAVAVREFASLLVGPSLDMLGPPLELLKHEGFVDGADDLTITESGGTELEKLLTSNVRTPLDHVGKVVVAAKFRFLHLLPQADRQAQLAQLRNAYETEQARLEELKAGQQGAGLFPQWIAHELALIDARLAWLDERQRDGS